MKSMSKYNDLTGQEFGKLKVISISHKDEQNQMHWLCKCECGNEKIVKGKYLKDGSTKSCGCLRKESISKISKTVKTKNTYKNVPTNLPYRNNLYHVWKGIYHRCYNKKDKHYKWYGEKGIKICNEWINKENGFYNFYHWSIKNGYNENLSIDRNNVEGNYEPNNCTWVNQKEQCNNMTSNVLITYKNKTLTASQWQEEFDNIVDAEVIRRRWNDGIRGKNLFKPIDWFSNKKIEIDGVIKTVKEWAESIKVSTQVIKIRYEKGLRGKELIELNWKNTLGKPRKNYTNIEVTINNDTKTLSEWAKTYNIDFQTIRYRYKKGKIGIDLIKPIH